MAPKDLEDKVRAYFCKEFADYSGLNILTSTALMLNFQWEYCIICGRELTKRMKNANIVHNKKWQGAVWCSKNCKEKLIELHREIWKCEECGKTTLIPLSGKYNKRVYKLESLDEFDELYRRYCGYCLYRFRREDYYSKLCEICGFHTSLIKDDIIIPVSLGYSLVKPHSYRICQHCGYSTTKPAEKWRELPLLTKGVKLIYEIKTEELKKIIKYCPQCQWQTQEKDIQICEKCGGVLCETS